MYMCVIASPVNWNDHSIQPHHRFCLDINLELVFIYVLSLGMFALDVKRFGLLLIVLNAQVSRIVPAFVLIIL